MWGKQKQLTGLRNTAESMKIASSTNSINMVNSENISGQSMKDEIAKVNDESPDKKMETLMKNMENFKT